MSPYRLAVDIGGTFTDATLYDERRRATSRTKVLSTPADPSRGFIEAVERILDEADAPPERVALLIHATTVATNAIIEGNTARAGFVTTDGFRDMLEIARQTRPSLYDLRFTKPAPLVARERSHGVTERLDGNGNVLVDLDVDQVGAIARKLREDEVETVAVCLLHSYANPEHERRVAAILRAELPGVAVSTSADMAPEFREFYRASTTVVNAVIQPVVGDYLERIESRLQAAGITGDLLVMQSSGGVYSSRDARDRPVFMVESGPAGGVIAAAYFGGLCGRPDVISFDMGGTTAKVALVQDGRPQLTKDYEVGSAAMSGIGDKRGSGHPIRTPVVDLVEIGAGGGSIAWVDAGGALRVGPRSAGADPGPACYGLGGDQPTVTDANLVLGRLSADFFLGGDMRLDVDAAHRAIERHCAEPLGMDPIAAAEGIVQIAGTAMANALRLVTVQRGLDPTNFALVAFGGAGPLHAAELAARLEVPTVIVPPSAGVATTMGLLVTDLQREYAATVRWRSDQPEASGLQEVLAVLEQNALEDFQNGTVKEVRLDRSLEMRYVGQSYELGVPLANTSDLANPHEAVTAFHAQHERAYGYSSPDEPVEIVNARVMCVGQIKKPELPPIPEGEDASVALKGTRQVFFRDVGGFVETPVYTRGELVSGVTVSGPAIIEEREATTVVPPTVVIEVDRFGNLLLERTDRDGPRQ